MRSKCMRAGIGYRAIGMWEVGMGINAIAVFLGVPIEGDDRFLGSKVCEVHVWWSGDELD